VELIDGRGRLFGLINLVDALVVLVVLAVVVAGVALVVADGPAPSTDTTTRYVTLDLGTRQAYVSALVAEGDAIRAAPPENLTITDVYATASEDGRHLYVRGRITATVGDDAVTYAGSPLRVGRDLSLTTPEYEVAGTITAVDDADPRLPVRETDVLLRANLSTDTAAALRRADEYRVDGRTVGTVRSITAYPDGDDDALTYVGVTYRTYHSGDGPRFAGTPVREGATLPVRTDDYAFEGTVVRRGATEPRGRETTRTVTLELQHADPVLAESLRSGMAERYRGETYAELTNVSVTPATIVLTSQGGDIYLREHPVNKEVTMTADLRVRETAAGLRFEGEPLRRGRTVRLDFGTTTVEATVVRVR
jgi:hypothetical protein